MRWKFDLNEMVEMHVLVFEDHRSVYTVYGCASLKRGLTEEVCVYFKG